MGCDECLPAAGTFLFKCIWSDAGKKPLWAALWLACPKKKTATHNLHVTCHMRSIPIRYQSTEGRRAAGSRSPPLQPALPFLLLREIIKAESGFHHTPAFLCSRSFAASCTLLWEYWYAEHAGQLAAATVLGSDRNPRDVRETRLPELTYVQYPGVTPIPSTQGENMVKHFLPCCRSQLSAQATESQVPELRIQPGHSVEKLSAPQ